MGFLDAISNNLGSPVRSAGGQISAGVSGGNNPNNPFSTNSNLFVEPTAGINTNFKNGDMMYIAAQAGRQAGTGRSIGIA